MDTNFPYRTPVAGAPTSQEAGAFRKKAQARQLKRFSELGTLNISAAISLVIALLLGLGAYDWDAASFSFTSPAAMIGALYLAAALYSFLLYRAAKRGILEHSAIPVAARRAAVGLIPFIVCGNIFAAIAGFTVAQRERILEYYMCFCAFINNVGMILIAALNLFKDSRAPLFVPAITLLAACALLYLGCIPVLQRAQRTDNYKGLLPLAILLMLTALTGNLFALMLGMMVLARRRAAGKGRTVEWMETVRRVFRNYMAVLGIIVIILLMTVAVCSNFTFDYALATSNDYSALMMQPSLKYPFGTDDLGRCVFTRIIFGVQISLIIGLVSTAVPIVVGGLLGAFAGNYGARLDNAVMRVLDIFYAVPSTLLAIAIIASFGASTFTLVAALSISSIPVYARTMRAQVMVVSNSEFVEAARACGRRRREILFRHIIPNSLSPMIVRASVSIGIAVLSTSSLSYLGLGVKPNIPEWGNILKVGSRFLETNPYLAIYPGIFIIVLVLAFNFLGDGLRDALDPKLK